VRSCGSRTGAPIWGTLAHCRGPITRFAAVAALTITQRVGRSLTLLRVFVVASGALLALAGAVLGVVLTNQIQTQALEDAKVSLTQYTNGVLGSQLLRDSEVVVRREMPALVEHDLRSRPDVLSIKVWRADGVLAWTSLAPERIGRRYPVEGHLRETIETGHAEAELEAVGHDEESEAEAKLGVDRVLEVYAPIRAGRRIAGVYEVYADPSTIEASIADGKRAIWMTTLFTLAVVWALLLILVRGASELLRRQTARLRSRSRELMESYARLERNSLEAIETLNATVEAKDPYTAGHSQRVQRVALAVGTELGVGTGQLDALRYGGLLHDIGKLAVPDAVLTKPGPLSPDEFELIKEHSEEGARIVGKLGRLQAVVPVIRHHHERWDGAGYPARLAGDEIPLEAAIVGLADAWDAMTTTRPYHRALTFEEALAEIREGRGTQFSPVVVDAFLAVVRTQPGVLAQDGEIAGETQLLAVG
jgi:putative nucleotidyltransferase with HDIG domain